MVALIEAHAEEGMAGLGGSGALQSQAVFLLPALPLSSHHLPSLGFPICQLV